MCYRNVLSESICLKTKGVLFRLVSILMVTFGTLNISFAQEPTLLEHGGGVRTVAFSPVDASLVASAGESNIIKLWNLQNDTGQTLRGHTGIVDSVAFSPSGELLASVSDDRTIKLWNVRNQQNIRTLQDGTHYRSVAFSPDGQLLATGGGMHVKLWDARLHVEIGTLQHDQGVRPVAFSPNGRLLAAGDGSGDGPGTVKVYDIQKRQVVVSLNGNPKSVKAVEFSPDNRYLACSGWNGYLKVWDTSNWTELWTLPGIGHHDFAFSPDAKVIVASSSRGSVNLYWVEDGTNVAEVWGLQGWRHPVDFSLDATFALGAEDGFVRLYNAEDIKKDVEIRLQASQQPEMVRLNNAEDIKEDVEIRLQASQQPEMVRLIYFLPNDRPARRDRVTALRQLVKDAQQFFADEMERHGYGRKTFRFETDATTGKAFVHHVNGRFGDPYYYTQTTTKVWKEIKEIDEPFYHPKHLYLVAIDIGSEVLAGESIEDNWCGEGKVIWEGGGQEIIIPASGHCFDVRLLTHELGHGFGLAHDFRDDAHVMSYGARRNELSSCAAEWLDNSRFFNIYQTSSNTPFQVDKDITVKMLPLVEAPPNGVRLRFEINDSDGLHQAQLYIPTTDRDPVEGSGFKLHSCRSLSGEVSTLEFITTELPKKNAFARLRVMDVRGNFKWWEHYFKFPTTGILPKSANRVVAVNTAGMTSETLQKLSGDNQRGSPNKRLPNPFVVAVRDIDNEPVAGVQVKFQVTGGGGYLSVTNPWTDSNGHAQTFLTLGDSRVNRVEVSVSGISERVIFSTDSQPRVRVARSERPPMYWIDTGTLHRLTSAKVETLVPSVRNAVSLAVDMADEKLYWAEKTGNRTGKIRRADLDGSNVELVKNLTSVPLHLTLDVANGKLYLINSWKKIQSLNIDGSAFKPNLVTGLQAPKGLAVDTAGDKMYWIEQTGKRAGKVRRANLDGSGVAVVKDLTSVPGGIAVDTTGSKVYITNASGKVQRMNLDGSHYQSNLITGLKSPMDLAVDAVGGKVYWTERDSLRRADLNGENVENVVTGVGTSASLVLGTMPMDVSAPVAPTVTVASGPGKTVLLANYPNPFNPETWMPYQLAEPADVRVTIYNINGNIVRDIDLGHHPAGIYQTRSRAAYWDGRNAIGEPVASGVYFYTLTAGEFTATRKLLIRK